MRNPPGTRIDPYRPGRPNSAAASSTWHDGAYGACAGRPTGEPLTDGDDPNHEPRLVPQARSELVDVTLTCGRIIGV